MDAARTEEAAAQRLTRQLKAEVGEDLSVEFIGPRAAEKAAAYTGYVGGRIVPERWHLVQRPKAGARTPTETSSEGMHWYEPIMGPDGEYVDPTDFSERLIADMKEANMWRKGAFKERIERKQKEVAKQKKARELTTEQRRDEMAEDWRAMQRIPGSGGIRRRRAGAGGQKGVAGS